MLNKSRVFLGISFTAFQVLAFSQNTLYKLEEFGVNGKVQKIQSSSENMTSKETTSSTYEFNEFGLVTSWSISSSGSSSKKTGKLIYDDKHQLTEEVHSNGNKEHTYLKFKYDENGYITEQIFLNEDGSLNALHAFIHNDLNQVVVKTIYSDYAMDASKMGYKYSYRYNAQGLLIEEVAKQQTNEKITKYQYNPKGLCTVASYSSNVAGEELSGNFSITKTYNEENQLLEIQKKSADGKLISRETFTYDHRERLILHQIFNSKDKLVSSTEFGEFDEDDNWLEAITYQDKIAVKKETREFTYF